MTDTGAEEGSDEEYGQRHVRCLYERPALTQDLPDRWTAAPNLKPDEFGVPLGAPIDEHSNEHVRARIRTRSRPGPVRRSACAPLHR
jgi:hypothetical protein